VLNVSQIIISLLCEHGIDSRNRDRHRPMVICLLLAIETKTSRTNISNRDLHTSHIDVSNTSFPYLCPISS
jgi:hypothetical protein